MTESSVATLVDKPEQGLRPIPKHVAVIMDGNGRWAQSRGLPRFEGHRRGVDVVRKITRAASKTGIECLTLYSFSTENWTRPPEEINELFRLLRFFIRTDLAELHKANTIIRVIGERDRVPSDILDLLDEAVTLTKNNTGLTLVIAFNYGARLEITNAVKVIAEQVSKGEIEVGDINADLIGGTLDTGGLPDPDLIIRTSGEQRLSNFLLWQAAYSEFAFLECNWPDFTEELFVQTLSDYQRRERRFGGVVSKLESKP